MKSDITKQEALEILVTMSALESFVLSIDKLLPEYLFENLHERYGSVARDCIGRREMIVTVTFDDSTHKIVPIEPTPKMNKAGYTAMDLWQNFQCDNQKELQISLSMSRWKAMVKVAPYYGVESDDNYWED